MNFGLMNKKLIAVLSILSLSAAVKAELVADFTDENFDMNVFAQEWNKGLKKWESEQKRSDPVDSINNALAGFWEEEYGSNGPTESEELLQFPSDGD
jgi:hypothetical protein|tara:strand:- start:37 stop:327 length:291 start_codon:yes stop_codon:yes gene_type:complete